MNSLVNSALIVNLTVKCWSATKFDKKITHEVDKTHNTKNAGRFNKILVEKKHIDPLTKFSNKIRSFNRTRTLPWGDNGDRVLPCSEYLQYTQDIGEMITEFNDMADDFCAKYQDKVEDAKVSLNGLFNPNDYPSPSEIRNRFSATISYQPLPEINNDFRLELSDDASDAIKNKMMSEITDRHSLAVHDLITRSKKAIASVLDAIGRVETKDKARFHGSLIDNIQEIIDLIPRLNYTNDPKVARLATELKSLIVDGDNIKNDEVVRENYKKRAQMLAQMF